MKTVEEIQDECLRLRNYVHPDFLHRLAFVMTKAELQAVTVDREYGTALTMSHIGEPYLAGIPIMVID
jgi:hypothetical protein